MSARDIRLPCPKRGSAKCRPPCQHCYGGVFVSASDDDFDDYEDDEETEALEGSAPTPSDGPSSMTADLLLDLIATIPRLNVLLTEADPAEFRAMRPRLNAFLNLVAALPRKATPKTPIGFAPPTKKPKTTKKGKK